MNDKTFFERLKQNPRPVVVDFWAPWCAPCRAITPVVNKLGSQYAGQVDVWKVNADEQPDLLRSLRIYGIPTLVAFHGGQEVARRTGAAAPAALSTLFEAAISGDRPVRSGPALSTRLLRLAAGSALLIWSLQNHFAGWFLFLAVLGAAVAFSAVYDRCPVYQAVTAQLRAWWGKAASTKTIR